jgi:hypothetical protein
VDEASNILSLHRANGSNDWLNTIEKKLQVVQCTNREMILFAAHQLVGPTADWWDAYVEAHEEPETINWQKFENNFRTHHVSFGMMKLKKKEFEDLKQGSMSVNEYVMRFTQLSHYAPDDVDTDEKKQDWFLNGLNDSLAYALEAHNFDNFQDTVDKALVLENRRRIMERKRKMQRLGAKGSNKNFRVGSSSQGPTFHSSQQQPKMQGAMQGFQTPQRQIQRTNFQSPCFAPSPPQRNNIGQNTVVRGPCFNCGKNGHFANKCPQKQPNQSAVQSVNKTPNRSTNTTTPARQNQARAHVNLVAMEDAQVAPDVIIGMILVNDNNAIMLFDSRPLHLFIAASFVQKYNLPLSMLKNQMIVSSPGGDMHARHVYPKVSILIGEGGGGRILSQPHSSRVKRN